jgi:predicted Zn-dependent protease
VAEKEAPYLNEVDGLLYGDDPAQGFVRGRRFDHPVMRIGFEAPEGFTLTNSPQAILISGSDGLRGEFGGGRLPRNGLAGYTEALIGTFLRNVPAEVGPSTPSRFNGVPALITPARVQTREGFVDLSFAAYEGPGGSAYHFVMAAPAGSADSVARLFSSFRLLSPQEAASLRPRVIRVVAAAPGETLQTLARRMASEHPLDRLLMLNARAADQPLKPGERLKIVTFASP